MFFAKKSAVKGKIFSDIFSRSLCRLLAGSQAAAEIASE